MIADKILSRLDGVKKTGPDRWLAKCSAHEDHSPSLAIRETADGKLLLKCFAGCDTGDVLAAIGLAFSDLYPERLPEHQYKPECRPFPAFDVLKALNLEAIYLLVVANHLRNGKLLGDDAFDRLAQTVSRISGTLALIEGKA